MTTIDEFFSGSRYGVVGTDPRQPYGQAVVQSLTVGGRHAYVVFPEAASTATAGGAGAGATGSTASGSGASAPPETYASLRDIRDPLDGVIFNIEGDPQRMLREVQTAVELGVRRIWIENRCEAKEAVAYAIAHGAEVVDNVCPLMVLDPHHIHWFHRKALDVFGKTPHVQSPQPGSHTVGFLRAGGTAP